MYYVEFKKIKFLCLVIVLFFAFSLLSFKVMAEDELILLPDDEQSVNSDFSEDQAFDSDGYKTIRKSVIVKRRTSPKRELFLRDSIFTPSAGNVTFNGLAMRVSLIIFVLIGALILIKMFLSRDQFGKPGSFLDDLTQRFTGNFSSTQGLKLKQTLILMPGQNLYLIEIDGKRLLVGGTQQGGVQFVADLTQSMSKNEKLDFGTIDMALANGMNNNGKNIIETPFMTQDALANKGLPDEIKQNGSNLHNRQTFKRRTNFRKSLFDENMNGAEELIHSK